MTRRTVYVRCVMCEKEFIAGGDARQLLVEWSKCKGGSQGGIKMRGGHTGIYACRWCKPWDDADFPGHTTGAVIPYLRLVLKNLWRCRQGELVPDVPPDPATEQPTLAPELRDAIDGAKALLGDRIERPA